MGTLFVIATPIGNLEDITQRAIKVLKEVDIILCEDTRTSIKLLNHYNIKNKLISYHKFNEHQKTEEIIKKLETNNIALISDAGTPCICDPGYTLIKTLREKNINVEPIGGISACITALSVSGINSDKFTFHGFFPRETKKQKQLINDLNSTNINTHIFYESPKRIIKTIEFLKNNTNIKVISIFKELTKLHEKNYYGTPEEVLNKIKNDEKTTYGEYTFIIEINNITKQQETISLEALLINEIIKNNITTKQAINNLSNNNISKNDLYKASLNLKNILNKK